jgi:hypothetical protein
MELWIVALFAVLTCLPPREASAGVTVFFDPSQVATLVGAGVTTDSISCEGYLFIYTRDKLFTGGGPEPIGRPVRVQWPDGTEAQYVTAGPNPGKAKITVQRLDGALFDLTSFTAMLLANAGAGRAIEIVPLLNGQEPLNDPYYFDVSGNYGNSFSYDTSPNPWGSTAPLVNYDAYIISLTLDYALTALTLSSDATSAVPDPPRPAAGSLLLSANPTARQVQLILSGHDSTTEERVSIYSATGSRIRSLRLDDAGQTTWDLADDHGVHVAAGVYFARSESAARPSVFQRIVILR